MHVAELSFAIAMAFKNEVSPRNGVEENKRLLQRACLKFKKAQKAMPYNKVLIKQLASAQFQLAVCLLT